MLDSPARRSRRLGSVATYLPLIPGRVVYAVWFVYLEVTAGPFDSPVHVLVGVVYLLGFGLGAGLVGRADRTGMGPRLSVFE